MKEPCAFSVSDNVTISIDDMLPLPKEFGVVNDFETSASVWKNLKMHLIKYVYNDLFLLRDVNKMILNRTWVIVFIGVDSTQHLWKGLKLN